MGLSVVVKNTAGVVVQVDQSCFKKMEVEVGEGSGP